jgi:hypothetical protein
VSEFDSNSLEKEDKKRVNNIRTKFYQLNEKFEQFLKFRPMKRLHLWYLNFEMSALYGVFSSIKLEEKVRSMDE